MQTPEAILSRPAGKFVHDFVGTDRALKRLSRYRVGDYSGSSSAMKSIEVIRADIRSSRYSVVDDAGRFEGCVRFHPVNQR